MAKGSDETLYWDPTCHIEALVGRAFGGGSGHPIPPAASFFQGRWGDRNWRNVPGPIYGGATDTCWVGDLSAPHHVLYGGDDDYAQEFLFRQPKNEPDLLRVLDGLSQDPFCGWARDGDAHWTPELVRDWWSDRARLLGWIARKFAEWSGSDATDQDRRVCSSLREYRDYIDGALRTDLRIDVYWLNEGRAPTEADPLPHV